MADRLAEYRRVTAVPASNRLWPLDGPGFARLGRNGRPITVAMPAPGPNELLVRHDACGLCFSDVKLVRLAGAHPRLRAHARGPIVPGHEVALTVARVGDGLRGRFRVGARYLVSPDTQSGGVAYAYGYSLAGGLSQYSVVDHRVLDSDHGCSLLAVGDDVGYAAAALVEPWAAVTAAYGLAYRTGPKAGGALWIIGTALAGDGLAFDGVLDGPHRPASLALTGLPGCLAQRLRDRARRLAVEVHEVAPEGLNASSGRLTSFDDIVILEPTATIIEAASRHLADAGIVALIGQAPLERRVLVDVGRIHYDRVTYVGGPGPDIASAYSRRPIRPEIPPGGRVWFLGASGPMGRMHVQRALALDDPPGVILCTARTPARLADLQRALDLDARARGVELTCLASGEPDYDARLATLSTRGFDRIVVLAPAVDAIEAAAPLLAPGGIMNIFAGSTPGTMVPIDLGMVYRHDVRLVGRSGAGLDDLVRTLREVECGRLSPARAVAAVGSLEAAHDGLTAVEQARLPGKVVIYPNIDDTPLTPLARLGARGWTEPVETEFLRARIM